MKIEAIIYEASVVPESEADIGALRIKGLWNDSVEERQEFAQSTRDGEKFRAKCVGILTGRHEGGMKDMNGWRSCLLVDDCCKRLYGRAFIFDVPLSLQRRLLPQLRR
jgi:hypothetical protein